jgi:glycosyltransferase involved in cell wall biosynthesis
LEATNAVSVGGFFPLMEKAMSRLRVVLLTYFYEPDLSTPEALLRRYATIRPLADALCAQGAEVIVLQRFHRDATFQEESVSYQLRVDSCKPTLGKWQVPLSFNSAVHVACSENRFGPVPPTVVHVNGLLFPLPLRALRVRIPRSCAIVAQHHADRPWHLIQRPIQRWGLRAADGFFFAAEGLARSWVDKRLITRRQRVFQVMEGSTDFRREDRLAARASTGLSGNPVVLWVGRLIALKDPLTVLDGFERILAHLPDARLYMAYGMADLLPGVRDRIASSPTLSRAVILLGTVAHAQLERIYNSADYFVLGSHYEGSSFSLAEALACGVVPVVTDIPSFRAMTDDGRIGSCWAPGNSIAFAEALLEVSRKPLKPLSDQALRFFNDRLSYPAIARESIRAYEEVVSLRVGKRP